MKVLVTGSRGLIGSAVVPQLQAAGHEVVRLLRGRATKEKGAAHWDPVTGVIDLHAIDGLDAAIHLAGENLANGRWTNSRKERIRFSRIDGTALFARSLASVRPLPRTLISASAVGFYGDRGGEILTEASAAGAGFLAELCREWESATQSAEQAGIRVAYLRFGIVLSASGGALEKMLLPFRLGFGGRIGDGCQYWSWVTLEDAVAAILHVLRADSLFGPINVVSPQPVTNQEFARALGEVLRRPACLPVPAWAARLALGEMADEALLASARVLPKRLHVSGFQFQDTDLLRALRKVLRIQVRGART